MTSAVRPLRPRLVIGVASDNSLDFAATTDIEVIIVHARYGRFRAFPALKVGLEHVRRLLSGRQPRPEPAVAARREAAP